MSNKHWKTISSETVISNYYATVKKNNVELPNGNRLDDFYTVKIHDSVCVVALTKSNEIILKREYRYCYDEELYEIPGGVYEHYEKDSLTAAKRELVEETGYYSTEWEFIAKTIENPSKLTNFNYIYYAKNCEKVSEQKLDQNEEIEVLVIPFSQAIEMVMNNEIITNCAAQAILTVARKIGV